MSKPQTLAHYLRALKTFSGGRRLGTLPVQLAGLRPLLNSMSSYSPHSRDPHVEEWNPFSQRPIFEIDTHLDHGLDRDFNLMTNTVHRFIIMAHEAMHILMWEPFFTGHTCPRACDFRPWSLAFEGFCFWISDVILNRKINLYEPDGQRSFERYSVSQPHFHPRRAFADLGLKDDASILDAYLHAFGGYASPLSRTKSPIPQNLARRAYSFYGLTKKSPAQMFGNFKSIGLFDEYFARFCKIRAIPALLPERILTADLRGDLHGYCQNIYRAGLMHIEQLPEFQIENVRQRRALQTRAYFAFSLRFLLASGNVLAPSRTLLRPCIGTIRAYIDGLEGLMAQLCEGRSAPAVARDLRELDHAYSRDTRAVFLRQNAMVGRRESILPDFPGHTVLQPNEDRSHIKPKNMIAFAQALAQHALHLKQASLLPAVHALMASVQECKNANAPRNTLHRLSLHANRLLRHPDFVKKWSIPLSSFDPAHNSYRELLFLHT